MPYKEMFSMMISKKKALGIALLVQLLLYCVQSIVLTLFSGVGQVGILAISCFTAIAVFGVPLLLYMKLGTVSLDRILLQKSVNERTRNRKNTVFVLVFGIATTVTAVNLFGMLTDAVFGLIGISRVNAAVSDPLTLALMLVRNVIIASVMEELLFRGAVLDAFSDKKDTVAVIVSALLFALMHYSVTQMLYAFAAGIVISLIAVMTGSVRLAIVIHFSQNFVSFVFSVLALIIPTKIYVLVSDITFEVFLAVTVIGGVWFWLKKDVIFKKNAPVTDKKTQNSTAELVLYTLLAIILTVLNF
jgi:membrane protease YdiL (CAAX protease family)